MRVFIKSKSGDYNAVVNLQGGTLPYLFDVLRHQGSYTADCRNKIVQVPFEEIEYIREATDSD